MDDKEVIASAIAELSTLFPMQCPMCSRTYHNFREWAQTAKPLEGTISYDAESGEFDEAEDLIGAAVLSNCPCGTTLSLDTKALKEETHRAILRWLKLKSEATGLHPRDILDNLRAQVREMLTANAQD